MTIWTHQETQILPLVDSLGTDCQVTFCRFCQTALTTLAGRELPPGDASAFRHSSIGSDGTFQQLKVCLRCGWWVATRIRGAMCIEAHDDGNLHLWRSCGVLKDLDVADISTPTDELRAYLVGQYADRYHVHPKKYEDVVGAVFADFGYRVRVTSYSGDDGLDVAVLDGDNNTTAAIQVKRQQGKVKAEQIRAFVGALTLGGLTTGIYVTTSTYQDGARCAADKAAEKCGIAIRLMDANDFYAALRISQSLTPLSAENPCAPYYERWRNMEAGPCVYSYCW